MGWTRQVLLPRVCFVCGGVDVTVNRSERVLARARVALAEAKREAVLRKLIKARDRVRKAQDTLATGLGSEIDENFRKLRGARSELREAEAAFEASGQVESAIPELSSIVVLL